MALTVYENRALGWICGLKTEDVTGRWRRLGWAGHVVCMGEMRNFDRKT
jgi:hypothetical protein